MEFEERNNSEIQRMVDGILQIAKNGLEWARAQESKRLDEEQDFVEWRPGDKSDEGYLIEELAEPLPTRLSIIRTMLLLQSEQVGSDEENIARFKELLSGKITTQLVLTSSRCAVTFTRLVGWRGTLRASLHFCITTPRGGQLPRSQIAMENLKRFQPLPDKN